MVFKDRFLKDNLLIFFSTSVASLANLLYQILVVRKLTVASYGALNSLLSVFVIISFPVASLSTMIAKFTSSYNHTGERKRADLLLSVLLRHMLFIGLFFLALYLIFGFTVKNYLKLPTILPIYLVGGMLLFAFLSTVPSGGLQGFEMFGWFSIGGVFSAILKLLLTFLFIYLGWEILGALAGYVISQMAGLAIGLISLREIFFLKDGRIPDADLREKYKFVIPSLVTLGGITFLTNIDVVLVKHFFSPVEAGYYSVAQLVGKIALFVPGAIYLVMFPRTSGLHAQQKDPRGLLKKSLKYTFILSLSVVIAYNIFPGVILGLLTGKANDDTIFLGRLFSVAMTFFALDIILLLYQLSILRLRFLKSLVMLSVLQALTMLIFHSSLTQVLLILLVNSMVLFAINLKSALRD